MADEQTKFKLNQEIRGAILLVLGVVLLLHTLNILRPLFNWVLILFSLVLIVQGAIDVKVTEKIHAMFRKKE